MGGICSKNTYVPSESFTNRLSDVSAVSGSTKWYCHDKSNLNKMDGPNFWLIQKRHQSSVSHIPINLRLSIKFVAKSLPICMMSVSSTNTEQIIYVNSLDIVRIKWAYFTSSRSILGMELNRQKVRRITQSLHTPFLWCIWVVVWFLTYSRWF